MADGGKLIIKIDGDDSGYRKATGGLSKVGGAALKGLAVGATAVGSAVIGIGTAAIKAYGDFEQLAGGAELMFGEAFDYIEEKAKNAFKTVQLSQNDYLKQVNGFAVGLKTAMGGSEQAAAELADRIVNAEADIIAATGNTAENVQNAFNGIMKNNFTMLDNLQIGITPTKEGFQELIDKVNAWNAENGKMTQYTIDNVADCQSALVDYIEMQGLSGYAANEAAGTIQGSFSMLSASWQNLLTGMADPEQDIGVLLENLMESVSAVISNLLPVIEATLPNIVDAFASLLPQVLDVITNLLPQLLPVVINGIASLGTAIAQAIPTIIDVLVANLPMLIDAALQIVLALADGLANSLPELIPSVIEAVITIVETLIDNIDMLIDAAIEIILALADGLIKSLPMLIEKLPEIVIKIVDALVENAPKLIMAALELILMLGMGLIQAIPTLIKNIPKILEAMFKALTAGLATILNIGKQLIEGLWQGILNAKDWLLNKIKGFAKTITQGIKDFFGIKSPSRVMRDEVGKMIALGLAEGIEDNRAEVEKVMNEMNESLLESERKYLDESERLKNKPKATWGSGFLKEVKQQVPEILSAINQAFGEIIGTPTYALESGNTVQHYTTYTERGPIVVEGRVELDGREVGRMVVDEGDAERRRRGTN